MRPELILRILRILYEGYLKELLARAVEDPHSDIDDFIMGLVDRLLGIES